MSRLERGPNPYNTAVSRRRFIKTAAWSGAALGVVGLGGLGLATREGGKSNVSKVNAAARSKAEETEEQESGDRQNSSKREKLGEYRTDYRYSDNPARKYNLRLSAQAVDGTVVSPGEVFSMNE